MFDEELKRLREFNKNFWGIAENALKAESKELSALNAGRIHSEGTREDGSKITPNYSTSYKIKYNKPNHVDLTLSGGYLKSYKTTIKNGIITIKGDKDVKGFDLADHLRKRYGNIEGLTQKQWDEVVDEIILPEIIKEFNKIW
jgi:hypothetical protein